MTDFQYLDLLFFLWFLSDFILFFFFFLPSVLTHPLTQSSGPSLNFFVCVNWGLNSEPTPLATPPALFCEGFFWDRVSWIIVPRLASNHDPPDLCLLSGYELCFVLFFMKLSLLSLISFNLVSSLGYKVFKVRTVFLFTTEFPVPHLTTGTYQDE
jgi:hypothetical protein